MKEKTPFYSQSRKTLLKLADFLFMPRRGSYVLILVFAIFLFTTCGWFIYKGGGTNQPYVHLLYIPVALAALSFRLWGGIVAGALASIVAGPWMPQSLDPVIMQETYAWLFRGFFFLTIGLITGLASALYAYFTKEQKKRLMRDPITQTYNYPGLRSLYADDHIPPPTAVMIVETRQLLDIEKAIGPQAVQDLLEMISQKLQVLAAGKAILAHIETGTFAMVLYEEGLEPQRYMDQCSTLMGNTFVVDEIPLFVEFYYGAAKAQEGADDTLDVLLRKARVAALKAISMKKVQAFYAQEDDLNARRNIRISHDFSQAMGHKDLSLVYQPRFDLRKKTIVGAETLIRWSHSYLGVIPPKDFIPLIESTLLINPFTRWVFNEATRQMASWLEKGLRIPLSLNFSMMNFQDTGLLGYMLETLRTHKIPTHLIEIEITETAMSQNIHHVADMLVALREQSIRVAIDDFGTGQSSLQYLCDLPLDTLKIDQHFIQKMMHNSAAKAIVHSSIMLGKDLGLSVVAEGIESQQAMDQLQKMGCQYGQGFFLSQPLKPHDLMALIEKDPGLFPQKSS